MISCDDCGILFENLHDLQRHIKTWCPEQNQLKRKQPEALSDELEPNKKPKLERPPITMSTSAESSRHDEDDVFNTFVEMAREGNDEERQSNIEKYMKTGLTEEEAMNKAEDKL